MDLDDILDFAEAAEKWLVLLDNETTRLAVGRTPEGFYVVLHAYDNWYYLSLEVFRGSWRDNNSVSDSCYEARLGKDMTLYPILWGYCKIISILAGKAERKIVADPDHILREEIGQDYDYFYDHYRRFSPYPEAAVYLSLFDQFKQL